MRLLNRLYQWYGKRTVWIISGVIVVLAVGAVLVTTRQADPAPATNSLPTVRVAPAASQNGSAMIELIGTVRSVSQAQIETEVAGRIERVLVGLGDSVAAGTIIAVQENASQRAAVLQAEGAYEAAQARASQSDVGVREANTSLQNARTDAVNTIQDAYITSDDTLRNLVDELFTKRTDTEVIGFRISGSGDAPELVAERNALEQLRLRWNTQVQTLTTASDLTTSLGTARKNVTRITALVSTLAGIVSDAEEIDSVAPNTLTSYKTSLQTARTNLSNTLRALNSANTTLTQAQEAVRRAEIGGTGGVVSGANADVKQALGSLRAAEANREKTILRAPIAGTVNSLAVSTGDFVGSFTRVAEIANNSALEITTYVSSADRDRLQINQPVQIEGTVTGTITHIAPAIDTATGKVEVRIAADDPSLTSGDTVTVRLTNTNAAAADTSDPAAPETFFVPINAVKFSETAGSIFTVTDSALVAHPVEIGEVRGSYIEILDGIKPDTLIVIDARGRSAGQTVEAIEQ